MGNPFDPMNIILLVFAVVAFIRLRATLGKRTGNEDPLDSRSVFQSKSSKSTNDLDLNDKFIPQSKEEILDYMSSNDKNFSQEVFLDGAKNAYKMIVCTYCTGIFWRCWRSCWGYPPPALYIDFAGIVAMLRFLPFL